MHIGVGDVTGFVHSVDTTPANTYDITATKQVLHCEELKERKMDW
ncbi:transposase [Microbulbifer epialgicus]|uniref:Transposase n=1 Tax=Microbulbifer epialgicus TaxID=393907 RepID=A0ABV4P4C4_9GAMM